MECLLGRFEMYLQIISTSKTVCFFLTYSAVQTLNVRSRYYASLHGFHYLLLKRVKSTEGIILIVVVLSTKNIQFYWLFQSDILMLR